MISAPDGGAGRPAGLRAPKLPRRTAGIKAALLALLLAPLLAALGTAPAAAFDPDVIVPGDRLVLRLGEGTGLAGPYVVDDRGRLAIVSVGRLDVAGETIEAAEALVRQAIADRLGLETRDLLLDFEARRPVMVVGDVEESGAVPWRRDLVVLEAIAEAGGFARRAGEDLTIRLEAARLRERIQTLNLSLAETEVLLARLAAEEAGDAALAIPPGADALASPEALERMRADQEAIMRRRAEALTDRSAALERELAAATEEKTALEEQLEAKRRQVALFEEELAQLIAAPTGVVAGTRLLELKRLAAVAESDIAALIAASARADRERIVLRYQIDTLRRDFGTEVRQAANDARAARAALREQLAGAADQLAVADALGAMILTAERAGPQEGLSIMRRSGSGWTVIPADFTTALEPADILRVPVSSRGVPRLPGEQGEREGS